MTGVAATELKKNFKVYAGMASSGEPVLIKRPGKQENLILINEAEYRQTLRVLEYLLRLKGYESYDQFKETGPDIVNTKYNREFLEIFGSVSEAALVRPDQGSFDRDAEREAM
ncbi:MAG: hypothetical protein Q4E57_05955 [Eubacteriales bacterium]|nr:hypothetical protein [Eubacteriales bacterium]